MEAICCARRNIPDELLIECVRCRKWYHSSCVGVADTAVTHDLYFVCPVCEEGKTKLIFYGIESYTTYRRNCFVNKKREQLGISKPKCSYGDRCYRNSQDHLQMYSHPNVVLVVSDDDEDQDERRIRDAKRRLQNLVNADNYDSNELHRLTAIISRGEDRSNGHGTISSRTRSRRSPLDVERELEEERMVADAVAQSCKFKPKRSFDEMDAEISEKLSRLRKTSINTDPRGMIYMETPSGCALVFTDTSEDAAVRDKLLQMLVDEDRNNRGIEQAALKHGDHAVDMFAVTTSAEGNCLVHAVCLSLWAIPDPNWEIRQVMAEFINSSSNSNKLFQKYKNEVIKEEARVGVVPTDENLRTQWEHEKTTMSLSKQHSGRDTTYLSSISIYILANIFRRSIVVFGDEWSVTSGIAGIFLPTLWEPSSCQKVPITLLYSRESGGHFSALAYFRTSHERKIWLPLVTGVGLLPIRYAKEDDSVNLIQSFMNITTLSDGELAVEIDSCKGTSEQDVLVQELITDFVNLAKTKLSNKKRK